eukprot:CAMPEP_0204081510 /NCGR_PEP_ID=MMETSP0360-20130528/175645_1 /ASSEMBLY_ACC=CAM_ASM_000342 /TAXON_ID=268821 /ORGANISM="Scrippsiella Hangoei, Strain SHTV-5" /LENGTH=125 /DNA_ID=CAMNT_0051030347 /DNA_START=19 /DNA_END=393 /DNA_ORIENTATION=-
MADERLAGLSARPVRRRDVVKILLRIFSSGSPAFIRARTLALAAAAALPQIHGRSFLSILLFGELAVAVRLIEIRVSFSEDALSLQTCPWNTLSTPPDVRTSGAVIAAEKDAFAASSAFTEQLTI